MQKIIHMLADRRVRRGGFFLVCDVILLSICFMSAVYLRFGFVFPDSMMKSARLWLLLTVACQVGALALFGLYSINWRFVNLNDLVRILKAAGLSLAMLMFLCHDPAPTLVPLGILPMGVVLIDGVLAIAAIGFFRISKRLYHELFDDQREGKPTVIVGVNYKTDRLVRELRLTGSGLFPVLLTDADIARHGTNTCGLRVVGLDSAALPAALAEFRVAAAVLNLPDSSHQEVRRVFTLLKDCGVEEIRIVPRLQEWSDEVARVRKIDIDDLLSREPVRVDTRHIAAYVEGRTVMVTGAAGSIGSEIFRRLILFRPAKIVLLDVDETELFYLQQKMKNAQLEAGLVAFVVGDVRNERKLAEVFERYRPQVVFHAAAYKHVPLMEDFPEEAVETNVLGTYGLAAIAVRQGVEVFVNISTDKAVNPTSVMGATKRVAESLCCALSSDGKGTRFVSVRFGNVLGSRGSVVPLFLEQIRAGGPLLVTHPEMKRYFMSIPEAVMLVFQAASMGKGGEVFVLDMGEPVKIVDLAENIIRLNQMVPYQDVDIRYTGLRPGEKLFEELLTAEEGADVTAHQQIFVARSPSSLSLEDVQILLQEARKTLSQAGDVRRFLRQWVPTCKF